MDGLEDVCTTFHDAATTSIYGHPVGVGASVSAGASASTIVLSHATPTTLNPTWVRQQLAKLPPILDKPITIDSQGLVVRPRDHPRSSLGVHACIRIATFGVRESYKATKEANTEVDVTM